MFTGKRYVLRVDRLAYKRVPSEYFPRDAVPKNIVTADEMALKCIEQEGIDVRNGFFRQPALVKLKINRVELEQVAKK